MRHIQIDGKDLDPCDPLSNLVEMVLLIQERKLYGRLEIVFKDGQIVHAEGTESIKLGNAKFSFVFQG